jgi:hypothetical protein
MFTLALFGFTLVASPDTDPSSDASGDGAVATSPERTKHQGSSHEGPGALRQYLSRPLAPSARFLDHGVMHFGVSGGLPHLYRLELALGLFDHLSAGVSAHWIEDQSRPRLWPFGSIALWRTPAFELGASYRRVLHTPTEDIEAGYALQTHYLTAVMAFSQAHWSAGVDFGVAHFKGAGLDQAENPGSYRWRTRPGGGVFARFGTRRWGVSVQGQMPIWTLDVMLDVRFGLFELRERGGWQLRPR